MLAGDSIQRLGSHIAQISRHADQVFTQVTQRVATRFPGVHDAFPLNTKTERFMAAEAIANLAKNLGTIDDLEPWFRRIGEHMNSKGLGVQAAGAATEAFLSAIRDHSGHTWNPELEADWRELLTAVFTGVAKGAVNTIKLNTTPLRRAA